MHINIFLSLYALAVPVFVLFDLVWLGVLAKDFYQTRLAHLLGDTNWIAACVFYLVFGIGLTFFAIYPAVTRGSLASGAILGALFGLFCYATYDLTNQATLRQWPLLLTLVDILWGTLIGAATTVIVIMVYRVLA